MRLLADKAVRDVGFYELYHPDTGLPYGGLQEEASAGGVIEWAPCRCQTWAATGFMDMAFTLLAGLRFAPDGLTFAPYLPDGADGGPRLEALTLTGLRYREAEIDLEVRRGGASGVWIDGRAAERVPAGAAGRLRVEVAVA